tara:strand:+ start:2923 stop:3273 length:351 start_codon:yes stop_codon:yes gene_type:complete
MSNKANPHETWTSERCFITELLNDAAYPEVSIARARVEPGVTTQLHTLDVAEWYVIESGIGRMSVGRDAPRLVGPGDVVTIPADCPQKIENHGESDLEFLCVCTPRFLLQHYTSLE